MGWTLLRHERLGWRCCGLGWTEMTAEVAPGRWWGGGRGFKLVGVGAVFVGYGGWDQAWRRLRYRFRGVGAAAVVVAEAEKRWWRARQRERSVAGDVGPGRHGVESWCWRGPTALRRRS